MSNLLNQYDVICSGGSISSYFAAALFSHAGAKVLLIDDSHKVPAVISDSFSMSKHHDNELEQTFERLGLHSQLAEDNSIIQVLSQDYRVSFFPDQNKTVSEMRRELPFATQNVSDFFLKLYQSEKSSPFSENIKKGKPQQLAAVLSKDAVKVCETLSQAILGTLSYACPARLSFEQVIRALPLYLQNQYYFVGGLEGLKKNLKTIIEAASGTVKTNASVQGLVVEGKKIVGVLLSSYDGICRGKTIILTDRLRSLYQTLPYELQETVVMRSLHRLEPSHWRFCLSLSVPTDSLPVGATSNMVVIHDNDRAFEEENFLRIQNITNNAKSTTLLVSALVPNKNSSIHSLNLQRLAARMLRVVCHTLPFIESKIISVFPDFKKGLEDLTACYPFRLGAPESLMQYYVRGHKAVQDFWGPDWSTPHQNLYFAGRSIWPTLGTYGEVLVARKIFKDAHL